MISKIYLLNFNFPCNLISTTNIKHERLETEETAQKSLQATFFTMFLLKVIQLGKS